MTKSIAGVQVELDHPDIKGAKSVADLKKLELFEKDNEAAYAELLSLIKAPIEKPDTKSNIAG